MKKECGSKCKLLYTDTDSLIYEIEDIDMYEVMKKNIEKFDTSDYAPNNPYGLPLVNNKVLGLMKDEAFGKTMLEFIGLRSKMYSVRIADGEEIKKAKGVKSNVVRRTITFEDYRQCLKELQIIKREQCNIRSKRHIVCTERQEKIALSPHDNKRYLLENSTDTLPWGHYRIFEENMMIVAENVEKEDREREVEAIHLDEELQKEFTKEWESTNAEINVEGVGEDIVQMTMEGIEVMEEWPTRITEEEIGRNIIQEGMEGVQLVVGESGYKQERQGEEHIQPTINLECTLPPKKRFKLSLKFL